MRTISKLFAIVLIVFFLFFSVSCSDEEETDIIGAHTVPSSGLPFQAAAVTFDDIDFDEDQINGSLLITKATDETLVDEYRVYWGSSATEKLSGQDPIATISADGNDHSHSFAANTSVPAGATHFLVYSASSDDLEAPPVALDIPDACYKLVKDIYPGTLSSNLNSLVEMNGVLYFSAEAVTNDKELWRSDGTEAGTFVVKEINTGGSAAPGALTVAGSMLYFAATDTGGNKELWKTDGSEAGTEHMTNFGNGEYWAWFEYITEMNGDLYFTYDDDGSGTELFKNNGTQNNQSHLTYIESGMEDAIKSKMVVMNNKLFFAAGDNSSNVELWSTDGAPANESIVLDIDGSGATSSWPSNLTVMNGILYFTADDNNAGTNDELWKSDGTGGGTVKITEINPGASSSFPANLLAVGNTLYFRATDGTNGTELWKTDGSAGGTKMVSDINPSGDGYIGSMVEFSGNLFFKAGSASNNNELWQTDGTEAGTNMIKFISSGVSGGDVSNLTVMGSHLFFHASDASSNKELWRTDGTEIGTMPITDFTGDICSECRIKVAGDKLFFSAFYNGGSDEELFVYYLK